jgi:hypothetical protein
MQDARFRERSCEPCPFHCSAWEPGLSSLPPPTPLAHSTQAEKVFQPASGKQARRGFSLIPLFPGRPLDEQVPGFLALFLL